MGAALVTGGTGKLGSGIAARLEEAGYRVLAAGSRDGDVSRPEEARRLVERCAHELGGLDLVVNGASSGFRAKPFEEVTEADWDAALGSVAKGSFFVTQAAVPYLRQSENGLVVMLEDVGAVLPWPRLAAHCAAKAAQAMMTRVLAQALAPEVRVCGVCPGPVAVEPGEEELRASATLLRRVGSPDDVAAAILYLVDARFVTGSTIVVDGGALLARPS